MEKEKIDENMDQFLRDLHTLKDQMALKSTEPENIQQKIDGLMTRLHSD